jgi:hypothetical protein
MAKFKSVRLFINLIVTVLLALVVSHCTVTAKEKDKGIAY